MTICVCCGQREIKPTFSLYCRVCYHYLQRKYSLNTEDYIIYFQIMYNNRIHIEHISFDSFTTIHDHVQHDLNITDKPLAELLEVILFLKVNASCIPLE